MLGYTTPYTHNRHGFLLNTPRFYCSQPNGNPDSCCNQLLIESDWYKFAGGLLINWGHQSQKCATFYTKPQFFSLGLILNSLASSLVQNRAQYYVWAEGRLEKLL